MSGRMYDYDSSEQDDLGMDADDFEEASAEEVDEMLDGLMDAAEDDSEFAERRRKVRRKAARTTRKPVSSARGSNAYRSPSSAQGAVTQKQLQDALARVASDVKRNAQGLKTLNAQVGKVSTRVDGVVEVNRLQSRQIGKLDKQMKMDAALDIAGSFDGTGLDAFQLFKGAVKSGVLGDQKGALGNPFLIGALGMLLKNPQILSGILPSGGTTP